MKEDKTHPKRLLKRRGLVLGVLGDGGMRPGTITLPDLVTELVKVLVRGLLPLRSHLHSVLRVGFYQRLGGKQAQVCKQMDKIILVY